MFKESLGKLTRNQDLTPAEVTEFVENMRDELITEVQIAGFLVAMLMKRPTADEIAAIARAMRDN
ncbi:MAG: anthranilate phosphoribosyltransferase, partial [Betaproteobacteria bacterium]|nr:anthranilate phosphoribosyltransferase [Betaproteobacteria bacterium]